jgi:hypothetical protein
MAVLEVAKIQVRSGLQENLPALDTGEFGWCVDTQRLFIGKGTLAEGAPQTGVTEILTEYSIGLINVGIVALEANVANLTTRVDSLEANVANISGSLQPTITFAGSTTANTIIYISSLTGNTKIIDYNIVNGSAIRVGTMKVTQFGGGSVAYDDDYSETSSTGVTLFWTGNLNPSNVANVAILGYINSSVSSAIFSYYVKSFT